MEIASWLLFGLWGLTVGVVLSYARGPGGGWLLWGAAAAQAAGALYLAFSSPTTTGLGVLGFAVFGLLAGGFVAGGHVWRNSPLLGASGYWSRCVTVFVSERRLGRAHRETARSAPGPH